MRVVRPFVAVVEGWQIRRLGTSVLGLIARTDVLLLETTGRRTGKRRATPVACLTDPAGWLIAGGAGGQSKVDWVANLRADPNVEIVVRRQRVAVTAHEPTGDEQAEARRRALARWPKIESYERRSSRTAPVFVLRAR